jgi:hypothetical protein
MEGLTIIQMEDMKGFIPLDRLMLRKDSEMMTPLMRGEICAAILLSLANVHVGAKVYNNNLAACNILVKYSKNQTLIRFADWAHYSRSNDIIYDAILPQKPRLVDCEAAT